MYDFMGDAPYPVDIDTSSLPANGEINGKRVLGVITIFLGLFLSAVGSGALLPVLNNIKETPASVEHANLIHILFSVSTCSFFSIAGLVVIFFGLNEIIRKKYVYIDGNMVSVIGKTLLGKTELLEPVKNYRGIMYRETFVTDRSHTYPIFHIELLHSEKQKTIELCVTKNEEGIRKRWEGAAKILNLPAIEKTGSKTLSRNTDDLDKSIKEQIDEGKLKSGYNSLEYTPTAFSIAEDKDLTTVTILKKRPRFQVWVFLIVPLGFTLLKWINGETFPAVLCFILFCFFLTMLTIDAMSHRVIRIDGQEIKEISKSKLLPSDDKKMALKDVESIEIGIDKDSPFKDRTILIKSDKATISIAENLAEKEQEWLRSFLIETIRKT